MGSKRHTRRVIAAVPKPDVPKFAFSVSVGSILAVAFFIRFFYLFNSRSSPFFEPLLLDPAYYHHWALKILHHGFTDQGVFYGLPLYPCFLALCYRVFENSVFAVKVIQHLLGLVTVYFVFKTGEKLADRRTGLIAAILAACYGPLFFQESLYIPEAIGIPLYTAAFYAACLLAERFTVKRALLAGILFGLAALTKAGIILFAFLFVAGLALRPFLKGASGEGSKGSSWMAAGVCLAAFLGVLAPVTAHNFIKGGDHVLLTSHAGFNFYIGNNPEAKGVFMAPEGTGSNVESQMQDSRSVAEAAMGRSLKPSEVSSYWSAKAKTFIRENPGRFLRLCARKFVLFFEAREISDVENYEFAARFNPFLRFPWPTFAVLCPLVLMGFAASFFYPIRHRALLYVWIGAYLSGIISFFITSRYRLPLLGVFFPLAAFGILSLHQAWQKRQWGNALLLGIALALGIGLSQARLVDNYLPINFVNAGDALMKNQDSAGAMAQYRRALELDPTYPKANLAAGLAMMRSGKTDRAMGYFRKTVEADPSNAMAYSNMGFLEDKRGNLDEAERLFKKAIELKPGLAQAHNNLGMIYGKRGENQKAMEEFDLSLRLNPSNPNAHSNRALILYREGQIDQARREWEEALRIDPNFKDARQALSVIPSERSESRDLGRT